MRKGKKHITGMINVDGDIQSLANSIVEENDHESVLEFILAIDLAFADMGFSEDLFSRLATSIAKEGEDACDMEEHVKLARKAANK